MNRVWMKGPRKRRGSEGGFSDGGLHVLRKRLQLSTGYVKSSSIMALKRATK